jgi:Protein of unknown function (DUF3311).
MAVSKETSLWIGVAIVLAALAVPWFMWGTDPTVAGLPVWVWWHVGWLALTAVVFAVFTRVAWGVGVEVRGGTDG